MPIKVNEALHEHLLAKESKIQRFLDKKPKDEVFTSEEIVKATKLYANAIKAAAKSPRLERYTAEVTRIATHTPKRFWGNPEAIEALKKMHKRATTGAK